MPTAYRHRYTVERIEVDRTSLDEDDNLRWAIVLVPGEQGAAFALGTLYVANDRGVGQVMVLAHLRPADPNKASNDRAKFVVQRYHSRPLYELARRTLLSQSAAMDLDFSIPALMKQPEVELLPDTED